MSYGVTQCYLPPVTSEHTPPSTQLDRLGWYSIYRPFKDGGLSKPRPRVQRATGPRLLRGSPRPARLAPRPSDRKSSMLNTRLSRHRKWKCLSRRLNVDRESVLFLMPRRSLRDGIAQETVAIVQA